MIGGNQQMPTIGKLADTIDNLIAYVLAHSDTGLNHDIVLAFAQIMKMECQKLEEAELVEQLTRSLAFIKEEKQ